MSQIDKIFPLSWGKFTCGEKQLFFAFKVEKCYKWISVMTFLEETTKFLNFEVFFCKCVFNILKNLSHFIDLKWSRGQSAPVRRGNLGFKSQYDQLVTSSSLKLALYMIHYICVQFLINKSFLSKTSGKGFRGIFS